MNFLQAIDDWLIDQVFQPISDWIRLKFGWSSDQVAAPFTIMMGIFFALFLNHCITTGEEANNSPFIIIEGFRGLIVLSCLVTLYRAWLLLTGRFPGKSGNGWMNQRRISECTTRKGYLLLMLIMVFQGLTLDTHEEYSVQLLIIASMFSGFCSLYFEACTDLPKPLQKRGVILSS